MKKHLFKIIFLSIFIFPAFALCLSDLKITKIEGNVAWIEDANGKKHSGQIIDTRSNRVGIAENDSCAVVNAYEENGKHYPLRIVCKSGRQFNNVGYFTGSATGTPPYLEYSNYIGQLIGGKSFGLKPIVHKDEKPGQARRTVYCDGPCQKK